MGILLVCFIALSFIVSSILFCLMDKQVTGMIVIWAALISLVAIPLSHNPPPVSEYQKMAEVSIDDITTGIFFNEFEQNGNIITIDEYATTGNIHWDDFNFTEVYQDLNIVLLDNDDKFIYTDRETETTYNKNKVVTQP